MPDNQKAAANRATIIKPIKLLVIVLFFLSVFVFFLKINLWDFDFWWHAATGRYIVKERQLPESDPFSFTSEMEENRNAFPERERFILKQYWLSQILFYMLLEQAGPKGIIILRSLILVLTLFAVYWHLKKSKVSLYISFLFLFLLFDDSTRAIGERPVLFSFLFTAVVFFILEDFRTVQSRKIFLLPPLMLVWANMHGGFILGDIIIAVFLFGESISIFLKKSHYTNKQKAVFYSMSIAAIACSFVNPNGWDAFSISFSGRYDIFTKGVQEYQSPFSFYIKKIRPIQYNEVIFAVIAPLILVIRNRKLNLNHIILLTGLYYMAATASRFMFFYAIIATMILAKETDLLVTGFLGNKLSGKMYKKVEYLLTAAAFCSITLFLIGHFKYKEFEFKVAETISIPKAAADFIEQNRLPGNMFNSYGYGGYLTWRLYPWKKNFVDSRSLNITTLTECDWIINATPFAEQVNPSASNTPLWQRLLTHYKINFMLFPLFDMYGNIMPLVFKTLESDAWAPIYVDPLSLVLIKKSPENRSFIEKHKVLKEDIYNLAIYRASSFAMSDKTNPRHLMALTDTFREMGRLDDAIKAAEYALKRMPENEAIREKLNMLLSEREERKNTPKTDAGLKLDQ